MLLKIVVGSVVNCPSLISRWDWLRPARSVLCTQGKVPTALRVFVGAQDLTGLSPKAIQMVQNFQSSYPLPGHTIGSESGEPWNLD